MLANNKPTSIMLGKDAENQAKQFLLSQGLSFVTGNYKSRFGEIDLIMKDKTEVVFVEVRMRKSTLYGSAAETVDSTKLQKIIKTGEHYIQKHYPRRNLPNARMDLIAINSGELEWIKNIQN